MATALRSTQSKTIALLNAVAKAAGLELLNDSEAGNTGTLRYTHPGSLVSLLTIRYDFQIRGEGGYGEFIVTPEEGFGNKITVGTVTRWSGRVHSTPDALMTKLIAPVRDHFQVTLEDFDKAVAA